MGCVDFMCCADRMACAELVNCFVTMGCVGFIRMGSGDFVEPHRLRRPHELFPTLLML